MDPPSAHDDVRQSGLPCKGRSLIDIRVGGARDWEQGAGRKGGLGGGKASYFFPLLLLNTSGTLTLSTHGRVFPCLGYRMPFFQLKLSSLPVNAV